MAQPDNTKPNRIRVEDLRKPTDFELDAVGKAYTNFYKWRDYRNGAMIQFQRTDFEKVLSQSRELFWNALTTPSTDLADLGLEFTLPYVRNEVLSFVSKIVSQNYHGRFVGEGLDIFGVKVLQGIYNKWRFKQNDKVEKFWEILYGVVNGTVCNFVGYNDGKLTRRYLSGYDKKSGDFKITEKEEKFWDDVWSEVVPIEDMYLPKIYERNFQKQMECIWKTEMEYKNFKTEFRDYDNAEYVYPGNMIAEDSLYFRLLAGTGVQTSDKIQVLKQYNWRSDKYEIYAQGVLLNPVGKGRRQTSAPLPWSHKMGPFSWGIFSPLDEKLAYGIPLPWLIKEPHKILNVQNVMALEHQLRNVAPPVLTSDFDAPKIIFGRHDVISVNDVESYKEMKLDPTGNDFFMVENIIKTEMQDTAQGGSSPPPMSKQPKSARERMEMQLLRQQAMGISLLMYYNILRQQMVLIIKTALQFYPVAKYQGEQRKILRAIHVPNMALSTGGIGNLQIRIVPKRGKEFNAEQKNLELFWESINSAIMSGRNTEIIEAPADVIKDLEFEIIDIDMEPEQTDEMKRATFMQEVIDPMLKFYVPSGIADLGKVFLRHLEKLGESPVDFATEKVLSQIISTWQHQNDFTIPKAQPTGGAPGAPGAPAVGGQAGMGGQAGNAAQSRTGAAFGGQNNQPIPALNT